MPDAGWWEALFPDPAGVLTSVGMSPGSDVIDLCAGDGWFTLQIDAIANARPQPISNVLRETPVKSWIVPCQVPRMDRSELTGHAPP